MNDRGEAGGFMGLSLIIARDLSWLVAHETHLFNNASVKRQSPCSDTTFNCRRKKHSNNLLMVAHFIGERVSLGQNGKVFV